MEKVKRELEELAFAELNPDGRASVQARLGYLREQRRAARARRSRPS